MITTAMTIAPAITHSVLAMPTAVITLSSENTMSSSMICVTRPAKLVRRLACASGPLADFVQRHPTVKMLALSFLMLIGMTLIADGAGFHVPKGYLYAAIGFSVGVEALNQLAARWHRPRGGAARRVSPIKRAGGGAHIVGGGFRDR
jgi:predicted tellurium resistance membrane protein TerC